MGLYFNPGNENFRVKKTENYVDKSEMIRVVNATLSRESRLSCVSRPRRFGKTYAAAMLVAYYDKSCDSHMLFDDLKIAEAAGGSPIDHKAVEVRSLRLCLRGRYAAGKLSDL